jgi:hypothetical protein
VLRRLAEEHVALTGSRRVAALLRRWEDTVGSCWVLRAAAGDRPTSRLEPSRGDAAGVPAP